MKTTIMKSRVAGALLVLGVASAGIASVQAGEPAKTAETGQTPIAAQPGIMGGMDHSQMGHLQMNQARTGKPGPKRAKAKKSRAKQPQTGKLQVDYSKMDHAAMGQPPMTIPKTEPPQAGASQMDHSQMDHPGMASPQMRDAGSQPDPSAKPAPEQDMSGMVHSVDRMDQGMKMGPMQGGSPPPDARNPDAYAEGTTFANLPGNEMNDNMRFGRILLDKFEYAKGDGEGGQNLDVEAWYGNDYNKAWFKAEGERRSGRMQSLRTEALWDRAFATFWSTQLGVRHDNGGGHSRNWIAFGVRGLAPYWFDTTATTYWSEGTLAARLNVRYELLFTQRLILEPEVEANLYSRADPTRGLGSGLSDLELGLRLRYEIRRQFAPYVGVTWARNFGGTADFERAKGERNKTTQVVAGVRVWF